MADEATRIEQAAVALLHWFEQQHVAGRDGRDDRDDRDDRVPVDDLVVAIGLDIARFNPALHPGTLGYLEPGEELIFLRAGLPEAVRRFTLAHELGHAVLHRSSGLAARQAGTWIAIPSASGDLTDEDYESICGDDDLTEALETSGAEGELLGTGQAYSARARREAEANAFAAALLLPTERLHAAIATLRGIESKRDTTRDITRRLAKRFGVSEEVLLRRLSALLATPTPLTLTATSEQSAKATPQPRALDSEQRAAVTAETPALIIAGPGSGKTTTLVARVAHLVRERGIPAEHILALTFSRKAAREMRERLDILLATGDADQSRGPLAPPQGPTVSTIHAFCGDVLRRYALLAGLRPDFHLIGDAEGYFLMRRVANSLTLEHYLPLTSPALYFPDLLRAISRAKDGLIEPEDYAATAQAMLERAKTPDDRMAAERAREVAEVYAGYQRALAAQGDADFGDLVRLCVRLFREHPEVLAAVRQRYSAVLVDEFQDINRAMGVLLQLLAQEDGALWAVGDADQAIYRFRGASPANLARFTEEYAGAHVHRLSGNYRSLPAILCAADSIAETLLPADERAPLRPTRSGDESRQQVTLAIAPDEAAEQAGIVAAILARRQAGRSWRDQAILCRTRRQTRAFVDALEQAQIPTRVAAPLLDQTRLRDVLAVLSLLGETSGAGMLRAGDLPGHRFSRDEARKVLATAHENHRTARAMLIGHLDEVKGLSVAARRGLRALGKVLADLRTAPDVATGLARYFFALSDLGFTLMAQSEEGDAEARGDSAALSHLMTLARLFDDSQRVAERIADDEGAATRTASADWSGFLEYVRVLLGTPQGRAGAEDELLAGELDAVSVLTVHASKGLEFPVVYVPGLANGRFPAQRQWERVKAPALATEAPSDAAHDEEEACLFYVAITRARDELILSRPERMGRRQARPSPFLTPIERRLGADLVRQEWPTIPTGEPLAQRDADGHIGDGATLAEEETLTVAAIETYARCPRQYAYRYVEGLESSDGNLPRMRRGILEALRLLHPTADGTGVGSGNESDDGDELKLAGALQRFDEVWSTSPSSTPSPDGAPPAEEESRERPFSDVYRRYGHSIIQRAWHESAGENGAHHDSPAAVGFEEAVRIPLGRRAIMLTVDRVEQRPVPATVASGAARDNGEPPVPRRYVRDRLGAASERPDLRALLYTLAAEQQAMPGAPVEVSQRNMATGEREPVVLRQRQRENLQDELSTAIEGMLHSDYTPRPEAHRCQSCPFLLICPA